MSDGGVRYRTKLRALLREREEAEATGGTLSMTVEYEYATELDALWHSIPLSEQEAIEREIEEWKGRKN